MNPGTPRSQQDSAWLVTQTYSPAEAGGADRLVAGSTRGMSERPPLGPGEGGEGTRDIPEASPPQAAPQ